MVCAPMTTRKKGYPFEVELGSARKSENQESVALADHVKSIDWQVREVIIDDSVTNEELNEVRRKAIKLISGV
ncbi:MAG: type II toxin-antitoxin system PemK/MazF family toxin [Acidobacteriota bacterium]|nr:type II toxin-antitoxin system PemK/MazF family toxin [Acidobacteriota bacterium]